MGRFRLSPGVGSLVAVVLLSSCGGDDGGGGGGGKSVAVPASDSSPPGIELVVVHINDSIKVTDGGSDATLPQIKTASNVRLPATGSDAESGILDVQIWMTETRHTNCPIAGDGLCSVSGPGLAGAPTFSSPQPQVAQGESATISVTLDQTYEPRFPGKPDPGNFSDVILDIWAVGINQLNGEAETAHASVTWYRT